MKKLIFISLIFIFPSLSSQNVSYDSISHLENYNFVLGTQGIGGDYKFTKEESALVEQAKHIRGMGSNVLKITLAKKSPKIYGLKKVNVNNTLDLFKAIPDYKQVFDMDFKYIFAWVHTLTKINWKKGIDKSQEKILYDEIFEFSSYILTEYSGSGKTFFIGNWEGDWLLHSGFNRTVIPPKEDVKNMTKWFQIRQKAIDDAKRKVKHNNVHLYHYIEVNLVLKAMKGETSISSEILPNVDVDFVSYSSYEAIKNRTFEEKKNTLKSIFEYLEKQLKPKEGLPFARRVFLGEYGYHAKISKPESFIKQYKNTKEIMRISLELDLPFALHWEMYNNEYDKKGNSKQMSLISEQGEKRQLYYLHKNYYTRLNNYLKEYKKEHKVYPSANKFNSKAIEVLKSL